MARARSSGSARFGAALALGLVACTAKPRAPSKTAPLAPTILASTRGELIDLASDRTWVAWCEHDDWGPPEDRQKVQVVSLHGGRAATLSSNQGCSRVELSEGDVYWSDYHGGIWKRGVGSRDAKEIAVVSDTDHSPIADFALDAGQLFILREDRLELLAAGAKIPTRLWLVPKASKGEEIAVGPQAAWATVGDDPLALGDGAAGLLRVDRATRTASFIQVRARAMIGLRVIKGRPTWTMNGATWEAPEAGGRPRQIYPFVVAAIDDHGFYVNSKPVDGFFVSYHRSDDRAPIRIEGHALSILPIAGGFIGGFAQIDKGIDLYHVDIGCLRW